MPRPQAWHYHVGERQTHGYSYRPCGHGGIGRRAGLKNLFLHRSVGSIPTARTTIVAVNYHDKVGSMGHADVLAPSL